MDRSSWSRILDRWGPAFAALLGVLIGTGVGYLGVRESIDGQLEQQQRQFEEAREQRSDDRRSEVYTTFLDAADRYAVATDAFWSRFQGGCAADEPSDACYSRLATELVEEGLFDDFQTSRHDYQGALNDVFVYGSDEAVTLSRAVSATVPATLAVPGVDTLILGMGVDGEAFVVAYQDFLTLMCEEVPAQPRDCAG